MQTRQNGIDWSYFAKQYAYFVDEFGQTYFSNLHENQ